MTTTARHFGILHRILIQGVLLGATALTAIAQSEPYTNLVLSLDGSSSYVTVPSSPDLQNPSEMTIEAWIYPQRGTANNALFINKSDNAVATSQRSYELQWVADADPAGPGQSVRFIVFLDNGQWTWVHALAAENTWVHVAGCFSSDQGVLQLYTNGVLANVTRDANTPLKGTFLRQTTLPVRFGRADYAAYLYAHGYMDEVRIWNKARTQTEIAQSMYCRLAGDEANLAGYWAFDSGTAVDLTGHGNNGTPSGGASIVPIPGQDAVHAGHCGPETPHAATASPVVVNGFVVDANVTDPGYGYTNTPLVRVIGGSGTGAQAVATVTNGFVTAVQVTSAGSGYTNAPIIVIAPPFIPQPQIGITALVFGPLATPVAKLDFSELSRYDRYQLEFKPDAAGTWTDLGAPFIPTASTNTQYVNAIGSAGFIRVRYVP